MTADQFFLLFHQYGLILVCAVIFCEYMNLPGFPAGVIMPAVGVLIAQSEPVPAADDRAERGVRRGRQPGDLRAVLLGRRADHGKGVRQKREVPLLWSGRCHEYIDAQHGRGLALCRIIPVLRTIVSIPAGLIRMPVRWFIGWSALGIAVWNTALISCGYFFGDKILSMF